MTDETRNLPEPDEDVLADLLSDEELDEITGGQGGRAAKHPQPGKPMAP